MTTRTKPLTDEWFEQERRGAIQWARVRLAQAEPDEPENAQPFVILDTETTGMGGDAEPVQITIIDHMGRPQLNTYIKPGVRIEYGAWATHGISFESVRNAPTFRQALGDLYRVVTGKIVICYNLEFDRRIIRQTCQKYNLAPPGAAGYECAMLQYARFQGTLKKRSREFRWWSLNDACEQMGIKRDKSHEAGADVLATLRLMESMALTKT